jgi:FMN phosphatase YigB (HAD superfamily)
VPATRLGIPTAWINRNREALRQDGEPEYEFNDLAGLADRLSSLE